MSSSTLVTYTVRPESVEENTRLVEAVYAELAEVGSEGFTYATYLLDDGVSFVHVAELADGHEAPLPQLAAFRAFQAGLPERCIEPPTVNKPRRIGAYVPA